MNLDSRNKHEKWTMCKEGNHMHSNALNKLKPIFFWNERNSIPDNNFDYFRLHMCVCNLTKRRSKERNLFHWVRRNHKVILFSTVYSTWIGRFDTEFKPSSDRRCEIQIKPHFRNKSTNRHKTKEQKWFMHANYQRMIAVFKNSILLGFTLIALHARYYD